LDASPVAYYSPAVDPQGNWLRTCTIVTGEPNELVVPIHGRTSVILRPQDYDGRWLGEKPADMEAPSAAYAPFPAEEMRAYPISTRVNSLRNDDPALLEQVASA